MFYSANISRNHPITDTRGQVTDGDGAVEQDNHYYPYGMLMGESSDILTAGSNANRNPYLYASKEYITTAGANLYDFTARTYDPSLPLFHTQDPNSWSYTSFNPYLYCGGDPVNRIDPDGRDWVEDKDGNITWREEVNKDNYAAQLAEGEVYRGVSFTRDKIWLDVNVRGNSETGIMTETYQPDGTMSYKNNTPWMDAAVEELNKNISESGANPEILKYFEYTQLKDTPSARTDETPWCAAFVNYCLEVSGIKGTQHALAFSFKKWGQSFAEPKFGSIAIMNYRHVGFVIGLNKDKRIVLLGGNQRNAVNLSPNSTNSVIMYVYPANLSGSNLGLPKLNLKGRSLDLNNTR